VENQKKANRNFSVGFGNSRKPRIKIILNHKFTLMETKQEIWENIFRAKYFTGKVGILFYQVFHQSSKIQRF
jgi:hypothetical protein